MVNVVGLTGPHGQQCALYNNFAPVSDLIKINVTLFLPCTSRENVSGMSSINRHGNVVNKLRTDAQFAAIVHDDKVEQRIQSKFIKHD